MPNPQFVSEGHGLFGGHESEDICTILIDESALVIHTNAKLLYVFQFLGCLKNYHQLIFKILQLKKTCFPNQMLVL